MEALNDEREVANFQHILNYEAERRIERLTGDVLLAQDKTDEATAHYRRAIEVEKSGLGYLSTELLISLSRCYQQKQEPLKAAKYALLALNNKQSDDLQKLKAQAHYAEFFATSAQIVRSLDSSQKAFQSHLARLCAKTGLEWAGLTLPNSNRFRLKLLAYSCYDTAAKCHTVLGQIRPAIFALEQARDMVEKIRRDARAPEVRMAVLREFDSPYYKLAGAYIQTQQFEKALTASEGQRARVLSEYLLSNDSRVQEVTSGEIQNRISSSSSFVSEEEMREARRSQSQEDVFHRAEEKRVAQIRKEYETRTKAWTNLLLDHPSLVPFDQVRSDSPYLDAVVPRHGALIEYVTYSNAIGIIVLHRANAGDVRIDGHFVTGSTKWMEMFHTHVSKYLTYVTSGRGKEGISPEAQYLYHCLLAPVEKIIRGKKVVGIIPDGILWKVPFASLIDAKGRYFVQDHAVFYSPSIRLLYRMMQISDVRRRQKLSRKSLLAIANPGGGSLRDGDQFLAHVGEEVRFIAKVVPGAEVWDLGNLTEQQLKMRMGNYKIIHIAAHGVFNSSSPLYSGVQVCDKHQGKDDGFLSAQELIEATPKLQADLVVLSACQTGLGTLTEGEGQIGLSWALAETRCPASVLTLWQIDDASTPLLMSNFYTDIVRTSDTGTLTKAEMLQRAQIKLLCTPGSTAPYYWSPFTLVGDWR